MSRRAELDPAVRQGNRERFYHHLRDSDMRRDADLPCRRWRQVHDATPDVGTAVFDLDDGAFAGGDVGNFRDCSERKGSARGVVTAWMHERPIRHTLPEELRSVVRGHAEAFARREIRILRPGDALWTRRCF